MTTQVEIQKTKKELGNKPEQSLELIKFLNRQKLEEIEITDRTETILEIRKVITKKNLMKKLEEKCENMNIAITRFIVKFENLRQISLPTILVIMKNLCLKKTTTKRSKNMQRNKSTK